ncbi:hypothetical protein FDECE_2250 [Fusarium decemcellulare]|nr:hypothetical protein FDECE_2250 [Fusarium decemcellulare]
MIDVEMEGHLHQRMRKPHLGSVDGAIARRLDQRQEIMRQFITLLARIETAGRNPSAEKTRTFTPSSAADDAIVSHVASAKAQAPSFCPEEEVRPASQGLVKARNQEAVEANQGVPGAFNTSDVVVRFLS